MNYSTTQHIEQFEKSNSFDHKLSRILRQENFMQTNMQKFETLTKREVEILELLANDQNNPQIAEQLFISRFTVEQHRKNINRKLEIKTYVQLYQYALAFDLV